jgi:hypothetical protein
MRPAQDPCLAPPTPARGKKTHQKRPELLHVAAAAQKPRARRPRGAGSTQHAQHRRTTSQAWGGSRSPRSCPPGRPRARGPPSHPHTRPSCCARSGLLLRALGAAAAPKHGAQCPRGAARSTQHARRASSTARPVLQGATPGCMPIKEV